MNWLSIFTRSKDTNELLIVELRKQLEETKHERDTLKQEVSLLRVKYENLLIESLHNTEKSPKIAPQQTQDIEPIKNKPLSPKENNIYNVWVKYNCLTVEDLALKLEMKVERLRTYLSLMKKKGIIIFK